MDTVTKKIVKELHSIESDIDQSIVDNEKKLNSYIQIYEMSDNLRQNDIFSNFSNDSETVTEKKINELKSNIDILKKQSENIKEQLLLKSYRTIEENFNNVREVKLNELNNMDLSNEDEEMIIVPEIITHELSVPKEKVSNLLIQMGIDTHESIRKEYQEVLMNTDFFLAFKILSNRMDMLPEDEIKQEMEDFFFNYADVLANAKDTSLLPKYALYLSDFIQNKALTESHLEHLTFLFPVGAMSLCFGLLVGNNALSKAKVFLPYINNNLNAYPNLIKDLISQNKVESLDFLLENTINHGFDNFQIMNLLMELSSYERIYYFFEKYSFNINSVLSFPHHNPNISAVEWNTLWTRIIEAGNYNLFCEILENSTQRPDFYVHVNLGKEKKTFSVFYLIRNRADFNMYIEKALKYEKIRSDELNSIFTLILNDPKVLQAMIYNGLIEEIFKHPNLKSLNFVEGQSHLFGFLSYTEFWCRNSLKDKLSEQSSSRSIKDEIIKSLEYLLNAFFERFPDSMNMPSGAEVNIFGSTVYLMQMNPDSRVFNLLKNILIHYQDWVNVEQPSGRLPIELVSSDNEKLKDLLLSLGASVVPNVTIWQKIKFWEHNKVKALREQVRLKAPLQHSSELQRKNVSSSGFNLPGESSDTQYKASDVEQEMRQSFNNLRPIINKLPLDIKLNCEGMFMKAEKLLLLTKDSEKGKFNEDVFFLVQTFNDYLPSILESYVTSVNLSKVTGKNDGGEKEQTLTQLNMLNDHIDKMQENMQIKMQRILAMDINKNTSFLKQRLGIVGNENLANVSKNEDSSEFFKD